MFTSRVCIRPAWAKSQVGQTLRLLGRGVSGQWGLRCLRGPAALWWCQWHQWLLDRSGRMSKWILAQLIFQRSQQNVAWSVQTLRNRTGLRCRSLLWTHEDHCATLRLARRHAGDVSDGERAPSEGSAAANLRGLFWWARTPGRYPIA